MRLAQEYLGQLKETEKAQLQSRDEESGSSASEEEGSSEEEEAVNGVTVNNRISKVLKNQAMASKGELKRAIAHMFSALPVSSDGYLRPTTGAASDAESLMSVQSDSSESDDDESSEGSEEKDSAVDDDSKEKGSLAVENLLEKQSSKLAKCSMKVVSVYLSNKPLTCCALDPTGNIAYAGGKDCNIYKVTLSAFLSNDAAREETEANTLPKSSAKATEKVEKENITVYKGLINSKAFRKVKHFPGHRDQVLCLDLSPDGTMLATGGKEKVIHLWSTESNQLVHSFKRHRDSIYGLAFLKDYSLSAKAKEQAKKKAVNGSMHKARASYGLSAESNQEVRLYSCSKDRMIGVWDCQAKCFLEEHHGHQNEIISLDTSFKPRDTVVTCSQDLSVRFWKITQDSQLVFSTVHTASVDCVKFIDESHFVSGAEDGMIKLWNTRKKKPVFQIDAAECHNKNWITAIGRLENSDVFATGAKGDIKIWKIDTKTKKIAHVAKIRLEKGGHVNSLCFSQIETLSETQETRTLQVKLVAAVGSEYRLGRWNAVPGVKGSLITYLFEFEELL